MKNDKKAKGKSFEAQRPGNPKRTGVQHNPSRLDPKNQQSKRHSDKLSGKKKQK